MINPCEYQKIICGCGCGTVFYYRSYRKHQSKRIFINKAHYKNFQIYGEKNCNLPLGSMHTKAQRLLEHEYQKLLQKWILDRICIWITSLIKRDHNQYLYLVNPNTKKKNRMNKYLRKICVCCGETFYLQSSNQRCFTDDTVIVLNKDHKQRYLDNKKQMKPLKKESISMKIYGGFYKSNQNDKELAC